MRAAAREKHNANGLFYESLRVADKVPATLITYGLDSYQKAFKKV